MCYDSYGVDGRSVTDHIDSLVESEHFSVLEHVNVSVLIEGISRGCSHELVRHRHFSYSQRSTRYTNEGDAAIVLDPWFSYIYESKTQAVGARKLLDIFIASCRASIDTYDDMVEALHNYAPEGSHRDQRKWARGKARQLLPHALETRMVMTGNLRSWRELMVKRSSRFAEAEIRRLTEHLYDEIAGICPEAFGDFTSLFVDGFMEYKVNA